MVGPSKSLKSSTGRPEAGGKAVTGDKQSSNYCFTSCHCLTVPWWQQPPSPSVQTEQVTDSDHSALDNCFVDAYTLTRTDELCCVERVWGLAPTHRAEVSNKGKHEIINQPWNLESS